VSDVTHGMPLVRRVVAEHRRLVYPLLIALGINVVAYAAIVYPLGQRVANVTQRERAADRELTAARAEYARANGTLTGKDRAAKELATFYSSVLPQDLTSARKLTNPRLPQLAREANLRYERASYEPIVQRDSTLKSLKIGMELAGRYADMRTFIYQLETAPEFVVIDHVELAEGGDEGDDLRVTLQLSTFYRDVAP
jgi:Tfp pilus assembly protein PilO